MEISKLGQRIGSWFWRNGRIITFGFLCLLNAVVVYSACNDIILQVPTPLQMTIEVDLLVVYLIGVFSYLIGVTTETRIVARTKVVGAFFLILSSLYLLVVIKSVATFWIWLLASAAFAGIIPPEDKRTLATITVAFVASVSTYLTLGEAGLFAYSTPLFLWSSKVRTLLDVRLLMIAVVLLSILLFSMYKALVMVSKRHEPASQRPFREDGPIALLVATIRFLIAKVVDFSRFTVGEAWKVLRECFSTGILKSFFWLAAQYFILLLFAAAIPIVGAVIREYIRSPGLFGVSGVYGSLRSFAIIGTAVMLAACAAYFIRFAMIRRGNLPTTEPDKQYAFFLMSIFGASGLVGLLAWLGTQSTLLDLRGFSFPADGAPTTVLLLLAVVAIVSSADWIRRLWTSGDDLGSISRSENLPSTETAAWRRLVRSGRTMEDRTSRSN